MSRDDYDEITSEWVATGRNLDDPKSGIMYSFLIPQRLITEGSSKSKRTINILAAFISDTWVWVIHDFMRLTRLHVISRDRIFEASDFDVNGPVCISISFIYVSRFITVSLLDMAYAFLSVQRGS